MCVWTCVECDSYLRKLWTNFISASAACQVSSTPSVASSASRHASGDSSTKRLSCKKSKTRARRSPPRRCVPAATVHQFSPAAARRMRRHAQTGFDQQVAVRFDDLKVVDPVGIKIVVMRAAAPPAAPSAENDSTVCSAIGNRLQPHLVETVAHRRGVGVTRAMDNFAFHGLNPTLHVHGNFHLVRAAAGEDAADRTHVRNNRGRTRR